MAVRTKWLNKKEESTAPVVDSRLQELLKMRLLKNKLKQAESISKTISLNKQDTILGSTETREQYEKRIMEDPSAWTSCAAGNTGSILPR